MLKPQAGVVGKGLLDAIIGKETTPPTSIGEISNQVSAIVGQRLADSHYASKYHQLMMTTQTPSTSGLAFSTATEFVKDFFRHFTEAKKRDGSLKRRHFEDKRVLAEDSENMGKWYDDLRKAANTLTQNRKNASLETTDVFGHLQLTSSIWTLAISIQILRHRLAVLLSDGEEDRESDITETVELAKKDLESWFATYALRRLSWVMVKEDGEPIPVFEDLVSWSIEILDKGFEADPIAPPLRKENFPPHVPKEWYDDINFWPPPSLDPLVRSKMLAVGGFEGYRINYNTSAPPSFQKLFPQGIGEDSKIRATYKHSLGNNFGARRSCLAEAKSGAESVKMQLFINMKEAASKWEQLIATWNDMKDQAIAQTESQPRFSSTTEGATISLNPKSLGGSEEYVSSRAPMFKPELKSSAVPVKDNGQNGAGELGDFSSLLDDVAEQVIDIDALNGVPSKEDLRADLAEVRLRVKEAKEKDPSMTVDKVAA